MPKGKSRGVFLHRISEAAAMIGVSQATLRIWESRGLLASQRTPSGYRLYSRQDIERLVEVRKLRRNGINLAGIHSMLGEQSKPAGKTAAGDLPASHYIGRRLRQLRQSRDLSISEVSQTAGLSTSFVSLVERGMVGASLASLNALSKALGTDLRSLADEKRREPRLLVPAGKRRVLPSLGSGLKIEQLIDCDAQIECMLYTYSPGWRSRGTYVHDGEEFVFVLKGSIEVVIDSIKSYVLKAGDSLYFQSSRPHAWRSVGRKPCTLLWVNTVKSDRIHQ